jgi:hypothetical protein
VNALVYVEKRLIVPIGAKLIGSSLLASNKASGTAGFNWFLEASLDMSREKGVETKIAELFPEDIFHYVYDKIAYSQLSVRQLCERISHDELKSADVVSISGNLHIPHIDVKPYNPFQPPEIKIDETYKVYGEECFSAEIETEGFRFPIFFLIDSKEIVCYTNDKPVEVVGVLKWSPSYEVGGFALNKILLGAALLLRR